MTTETIMIKGITYEVISRTPFEHNGKQRFELVLRRPKGKRHYLAFQYENGVISDPLSFAAGSFRGTLRSPEEKP